MTNYIYRHTKTGKEITITTDGDLNLVARILVQLKGSNALDYELVGQEETSG